MEAAAGDAERGPQQRVGEVLAGLFGADAPVTDALDICAQRGLDLAALPGHRLDDDTREVHPRRPRPIEHLFRLAEQRDASEPLAGGGRRRLHRPGLRPFGEDHVPAGLARLPVQTLAQVHGTRRP